MPARFESWGRYPRVEQHAERLHDRNALLPNCAGSLLPYGNGRSYGDSCLNPGGRLLHTRGLDRLIGFDVATGRLICESGILLSEILEIVVPQGWFVPVTPGTRFVTVGGAIANDVHGKNHQSAGSFGNHVIQFELLRSDGERRLCSPDDQSGFFDATIGGLGLTGVVTWAELQLRRIAGPWMETETIRFPHLRDFFPLSREAAADHEYSVAWIDCLAPEATLGRGLLIRGNHAPASPEAQPTAPGRTFTMPFTPPVSLVNRLTLRPFNWLYYHRQRTSHQRAVQHYGRFFYPLDRIMQWNRMYGRTGFLQYQCVLPPGCSEDGIAELLREISRSRQGSFLAVLKEFGRRPSLGLMSFPRPGVTLALDFPSPGPALFALLDRLDSIVDAAGGAIYPAKDARLRPASFRAAYPRWQDFSRFVDPKFSSGFWQRVTGDICNGSS